MGNLNNRDKILGNVEKELCMSDAINTTKIKVVIAGIGTIDECEHCKTEFTNGFACWMVDEWKSLNLCHICLKQYYEETWEQITQGLDTYEKAKNYRDSDFCKKRWEYAFIVCTINEA